MSEWREFVHLTKKAPKSDVLVLVTTFVLTVVFDLVVAIEFGIVLAALLFMKRMADVTTLYAWKNIDEEEEEVTDDPENIQYKKVPENTLVYEINGPMFFAAADKFTDIATHSHERINAIIFRMRAVPAMDATVMRTLNNIYDICKAKNITLIFSHVMEQPMSVMEKDGFPNKIGRENFVPNIDAALKRASEIA